MKLEGKGKEYVLKVENNADVADLAKIVKDRSSLESYLKSVRLPFNRNIIAVGCVGFDSCGKKQVEKLEGEDLEAMIERFLDNH